MVTTSTLQQAVGNARPHFLFRFPKILILGMMLVSSPLVAYPGQDDETLGSQAIRYRKKSSFWFRFDFAGVDTKTTTSPPGTSYLDRRAESFANVGGDIALAGGKWGLRPNLKLLRTIKKGEEETPPLSPKTATRLDLHPSLDVTFISQRGIEVIAGVTSHMVPSESSEVASDLVVSTMEYGPASYVSYHLGFLKRGTSWSGGFYYSAGNETKRDYTQTVSDGSSSTGKSNVQTPSEYGIVADLATSIGQFEVDFASVQASDGGERTADGNLVVDDYLRGKLASFFALGNGLGLQVSLHHQTLSYANNAYASVDTIPVSAIKTLILFGDRYRHTFVGLSYGTGSDGTSITEYNATFSLKAVAISTGMFYPF